MQGNPVTDDVNVLRQKLDRAFADFHGGRIGPAASACRDVLDYLPNQPDALHLMAMIAYRMSRFELALQLFDETVKAAPQLAQAWSNRALVLRILGKRDEALASARQAIASDPSMAGGWDIAGLVLREQRDYAASLEHHARAATLDPESASIQNNYAVALAARHRLGDAWQAANKAARLAPAMAAAQLTLANILSASGRLEDSLAYYKKSYALDPSFTEAVATEGRIHFLMGEFAEGWACMERRVYDRARFDVLPRWQGEKIKHLLLYAEQGMGDVVQFLRYVPYVKERAECITFQVPAPLKKLIAAHMPDIPLITPEEPLPKADAFGLLMSVPFFAKTTLKTIPAPIPYLHALDAWRASWRERLTPVVKPRIGIVWAGNRDYANDHMRSLAFAQLAPLLACGAKNFVSLQKGSSPNADSGVFDAAPLLDDFTATAGLIAELDLVISADTAVAHLAGAMGKPVWALLPFSPDWRWMLVREDSPWYPTMRLFRQTAPGDWRGVTERVATELRKFLAGDKTVLNPARWSGAVPRQPLRLHDLPED